MERIYLTHILPHRIEIEYGLSVAASNFSWTLINGGVFDKFYSIMPSFVSSRPEVELPELIWSDLRSKGRIAKHLAIITENWKIFQMLPHKCSVWLYNITTLNLALFFFIRWFRPKVKTNVIILDYTPAKGMLSRLTLWAYNHADGTIKLANSPLFTVKNSICLPGVTPLMTDGIPQQAGVNRCFLMSGVLNERIALVSMVLEAFSRMPELTLHITGFVEDLPILERYKRCKNIVFHGKLNYDDYLEVFHGCSFQLSTRDPDSPENQCNFPSKILEALLHNRIVVSTLQYSQLEGIRYFNVAANVDEFVKDIERISNLSDSVLLSYANQSSTVIDRYNVNIWKDTMHRIESQEI